MPSWREGDLRRGLAHLQAAEFLYETSLFPDLEYTFKHALTHEVAYGSVLQDRRRVLHGRIVEAIETLDRDRLPEQVERLAHHALRGELWDKAAAYLRQAGAKASGRFANREAVASFKQALEALRHLPESPVTIEHAIDIQIDLRRTLVLLGDYEATLHHLREAETLAMALGDRSRLGRIFAYLTETFRMMGDPERAVESGQRALAVSVELDDFALQVLANDHLGPAYMFQADYRAARDVLMRNVRALTGELTRERFGWRAPPSISSRTWLVLCLAELGEFTEGLRRAEEALELATTEDVPLSLVLAYLAVGEVHLWKGELPNAITALERGLGFSRAGDIPVWAPTIAARLGHAYALSGRVAQGVSLLEESVERASSMRIVGRLSRYLVWLSEAHLLAGRTDEAIAAGESAISHARESKQRGDHAWALRLLGELAGHRESPSPAQADLHYRQSMSRATELGMRPLVAHCHLGLGRLYRRTGERVQAPSTSPSRPRCTARWTCSSGCSRRRRSRGRWREARPAAPQFPKTSVTRAVCRQPRSSFCRRRPPPSL